MWRGADQGFCGGCWDWVLYSEVTGDLVDWNEEMATGLDMPVYPALGTCVHLSHALRMIPAHLHNSQETSMCIHHAPIVAPHLATGH